MKKHYLGLGLVLGSLVLAGCAGQSGVQPDDTQDQEAQTSEGVETGGAQMGQEYAGNPFEDPANPLSKRVFYFPLDGSEVSGEDQEVLAAHARYLASNPQASISVEGHADERGSREYNLGLGERRAKAVERVLMAQGSTKNQLQVVSYGEERPAENGSNESAWQLNRRVELMYSGN